MCFKLRDLFVIEIRIQKTNNFSKKDELLLGGFRFCYCCCFFGSGGRGKGWGEL
jgi:hypothetical protein